MNVGVTLLLITISIVAVVPHDDVGVKVYWVVPVADVLIVAGLQVPAMPLFDVDGSVGAAEFWHS